MEENHLIELKSLLADILDIDVKEIRPDAHFVEDLEVDSLMALEVLVKLEKTYQIKIPEKELRNITSLQKVYDLLKAKGAFGEID